MGKEMATFWRVKYSFAKTMAFTNRWAPFVLALILYPLKSIFINAFAALFISSAVFIIGNLYLLKLLLEEYKTSAFKLFNAIKRGNVPGLLFLSITGIMHLLLVIPFILIINALFILSTPLQAIVAIGLIIFDCITLIRPAYQHAKEGGFTRILSAFFKESSPCFQVLLTTYIITTLVSGLNA